ncbi:class I SAM-dependent methyltransferase, partial [Streptacidiphilus melanogenes]|uniref:class I SAM-dependent methyltransferase n=1 Tax=Streptacidiphilus melanogenes TaxID=411235 RepID=UPI0005A8A909
MTTEQTTASPEAQTAEGYLRAFHDKAPGRLVEGVNTRRVSDGRTSHEVLADRVGHVRSVLDLGCADGGLLALFGARGVETLAGVDLSSRELEIARRRPELADARLHHGRAQELPFADHSFDAVVSHMALMLMADVEQVVAEAARVLVAGGVLAVAVGGGPVGGEAMELFLELATPYLMSTRTGERRPRLGDPRSRTREGLDGLLAPQGFAPADWEPFSLSMSGSTEEVWRLMLDTYYDLTQLDEATLEQLHQEFADASRSLLTTDRQLPCGLRINLATTRLTGTPL